MIGTQLENRNALCRVCGDHAGLEQLTRILLRVRAMQASTNEARAHQARRPRGGQHAAELLP